MRPLYRSSSCNVIVAACLALSAAVGLSPAQSQTPASRGAAAKLDYEFFKNKVQPVFLTKRPGHARCVMCHTVNNAPFHLVPLSPGAAKAIAHTPALLRAGAAGGCARRHGQPARQASACAGSRRRPSSRRRPAIRLAVRPGLDDIESIRIGSNR